MRNRWRFVGVHVVLAVVLVLLVDLHHFPSSGASVADSFAIMSIRIYASIAMPFLAGLITWAIFGRTDDPPALGFGLRYTALAVVSVLLVWGLLRLTPAAVANIIVWMNTFVYVTPVLIVAAALLSLRRWKLPGIGRT